MRIHTSVLLTFFMLLSILSLMLSLLATNLGLMDGIMCNRGGILLCQWRIIGGCGLLLLHGTIGDILPGTMLRVKDCGKNGAPLNCSSRGGGNLCLSELGPPNIEFIGGGILGIIMGATNLLSNLGDGKGNMLADDDA